MVGIKRGKHSLRGRLYDPLEAGKGDERQIYQENLFVQLVILYLFQISTKNRRFVDTKSCR